MRNIKKNIKKNIRKTIKKTKKFKRLNCSPLLNKHNQTKKLNNISCYNNKGLIKLRNYWNERHSDKKIVSNDPFEIWKEIQENLKNVCNTEMCWLRQKFIENNNRNLLDIFILYCNIFFHKFLWPGRVSVFNSIILRFHV